MEKLCCEEFRLLELPAPDVLDDPRAVQTTGAYSDKDPEEVIDQMTSKIAKMTSSSNILALKSTYHRTRRSNPTGNLEEK